MTLSRSNMLHVHELAQKDESVDSNKSYSYSKFKNMVPFINTFWLWTSQTDAENIDAWQLIEER